MIAKLEADSRRPSVVPTQDTSSVDACLTECTSEGKFRDCDATDSISNMRDTIWDRFQELDLRIALTALIESESAEPFLCDDSEHGLLGLHTIQQRLDEGKYVDANLFWSDIDECLSICASAGRHPFMVWDMRTCFQQFEEDFWAASKSVATSSRGIPRTHDAISISHGHGWCPLEPDLRIALTALIESESAEPFLCDHSGHGLLGLHTIQQRLDEGKYVDVNLFWSDIDECLSVCASAGRHPFIVWDMRACFQQLEEDFWAASKSVATSSRGIPRTHDAISISHGHGRCFLEPDLRIALTALIESESAEPFLCDQSGHGLLGLHTIQQRLDEGKYADVNLFWSDIDECLSICASAGRHPIMVWDMRACFQQLEEDFWVASKSVATSSRGIPKMHDTISIGNAHPLPNRMPRSLEYDHVQQASWDSSHIAALVKRVYLEKSLHKSSISYAPQ